MSQQPQIAQPQVAQRLIWSLDTVRSFKHKDESGKEMDLQRVYQLVLPYGAPFDEVYSVVDELINEIKRIEVISKEQAAKAQAEAQAEKEEKEKTMDTEEASKA